MNTRIAGLALVACAACATKDVAVDRRALALEGEWRVDLEEASSSTRPHSIGRVALVAVEHGGKAQPSDEQTLAAGAIAIDTGNLGQRVADGTRVTVHMAGSDSLSVRLASTRGEYFVILRGALHGDTLSGVWQSVLSRSIGERGTFLMIRRR